MRNQFPFRRGGTGDEPTPPSQPDAQNFVQVPEHFTHGLSPEQWQALQATYRTAWENARRALSDPDGNLGGAENYQI